MVRCYSDNATGESQIIFLFQEVTKWHYQIFSDGVRKQKNSQVQHAEQRVEQLVKKKNRQHVEQHVEQQTKKKNRQRAEQHVVHLTNKKS